jgi:transketolase
MFRSILGSVVFYPSDALSAEKLVEVAARHKGIVYLRTTRKDTPIIYTKDEEFQIGGCKVLRKTDDDSVIVVTAGITLHEALSAWEEMKNEGIFIRLVDLYCIKPVDRTALEEAARDTKAVITVEDHFAEGGLGEAVKSALAAMPVPIYSLAVRKMPGSGKPGELLDYEGISKNAIVKKIKEIL